MYVSKAVYLSIALYYMKIRLQILYHKLGNSMNIRSQNILLDDLPEVTNTLA